MSQENQAVASGTVVANSDPNVSFEEMKFRFKKDKLGVQRPTVVLKLPVPNVAGIIAILEKGGKGLELLLEATSSVVRSVAVGIVGDDEKIAQETFPMDKVTWDAIANAPRAERTTIAAETWEAFSKDYLEIMPALTNKDAETLGNHVQVYLKKLAQIKTNKPILSKLQQQFAIYVDNTKKGEEFEEVINLLAGKFETYLKANDIEQLIANL
jgi:hypothetical protein